MSQGQPPATGAILTDSEERRAEVFNFTGWRMNAAMAPNKARAFWQSQGRQKTIGRFDAEIKDFFLTDLRHTFFIMVSDEWWRSVRSGKRLRPFNEVKAMAELVLNNFASAIIQFSCVFAISVPSSKPAQKYWLICYNWRVDVSDLTLLPKH